jgi:hypothetical protein
MVKDSLSDAPWVLEIKYISNRKEVDDEADRKYPSEGVPAMEYFSTPDSTKTRIARHNREMIQKRQEYGFDRYEVGTLSFPVYHLGDKLYGKMVSLIDNFKAEGGYVDGFDGYTATFRCVVGDELWTLTIHQPQKRALQMSNLCRQIIEDAMEGNEFDEWKYVRMLEPVEF